MLSQVPVRQTRYVFAAISLMVGTHPTLGAQQGTVKVQDVAPAPCGPIATSHAGWDSVSPRVFGAYEAIERTDGRRELCFLILWRGEPGWHEYRAAALAAAVKDEMIDSVAAYDRAQRRSHWPREMFQWEYLGDIQLELHYNPATRHLWIYGTDVDLTSNNVVLLDHVDRIGGTAGIVGTARIDPALMQINVPFSDLIKRSPALLEFIR